MSTTSQETEAKTGEEVDDMRSPFDLSDDTPVYVISVAAQLAGLHPQTLRAYDRLGLVSPGRATGRGRRYSLRDILTLREVQRLSQEDGVNLSGIKRILELEHELIQAPRAAGRDARGAGTAPDGTRIDPFGGGPARRAAAQPWRQRPAGTGPRPRPGRPATPRRAGVRTVRAGPPGVARPPARNEAGTIRYPIPARTTGLPRDPESST